uniref:Reverse transcriptase domain-containing protein n=1 Tax=Nothobranchius furzeri TaxID=105023 RepID=A0A8C6LI35_NOTFU
MCDEFRDFFIGKVAALRATVSRAPACGRSVTATRGLVAFEQISLDDLIKIAGKAKPSGSPDEVMPTRLLKEVFPVVAPLILHIINMSLSSGIVPDDFKKAVIQPLLKKHGLDASLAENYRPISKLPFLSKVLEKCVYHQFLVFMDENAIFETFQSGFRALHSTETALVRVLNDIYLATDSGNSVLLLLLDLTAAFDTIDHEVLLHRLHHYVGISGLALEWFRSYLTNRKMCVRMGSYSSEYSDLPWGVPQGSILGPLLFSIYILPLGDICRELGVQFHLYADDCQLYLPLNTSSGLSISILTNCLREIKTWMTENVLSLNDQKTEAILFAPSRHCDSSLTDCGSFNGQLTTSVTNLGVKLDSALSFDTHINGVISSSFFHLRRLAKVKPFLSRHDLETVVHAFITVRLDYCNSVLFGVSKGSIARLQMVQNAAARFLEGRRKFDHITPVLAALHWLPVDVRIHFKILLLVFKMLNGLAPPYLVSLLQPYTPSRSLRSENFMLLSVPRTCLKTCGDRAFAAAGPKLWNKLPLSIRASTSVAVFKARLKTYFYDLSFNLSN